MMAKAAHKILVVDDSEIIRQGLINIIAQSDELQVVGEASSGDQALSLIPKLKPQLITLDVIMPGMNGLTTLKHIMIRYPTPTLMLSALVQEGAQTTFDALRYGAIDFIPKPSRVDGQNLQQQSEQIIQKILIGTKVKVNSLQHIRVSPKKNSVLKLGRPCQNVVAIGVAEGGYASLLKILLRLNPDPFTAYMVIFYETSLHVDNFIHYLNHYTQLPIQRPLNNMLIEAGVCYLSSGEEYVTLHGQRGELTTYVSAAPFSSRRGTIDMLMFSVAEAVGKHCLGVILTGEGTDGSEGLEEIIRVGGGAIIQAPVSCLYKSMVLSALNMCGAEMVVADSEIAAEINAFVPQLNF
ncbi:MAG: Protein-glutamate methylesterase/protein-glutamine glutaminase 2 [Pseudomonadota bacterium]|jgi:two-component system chemotaxis response regulator CheB